MIRQEISEYRSNSEIRMRGCQGIMRHIMVCFTPGIIGAHRLSRGPADRRSRASDGTGGGGASSRAGVYPPISIPASKTFVRKAASYANINVIT